MSAEQLSKKSGVWVPISASIEASPALLYYWQPRSLSIIVQLSTPGNCCHMLVTDQSANPLLTDIYCIKPAWMKWSSEVQGWDLTKGMKPDTNLTISLLQNSSSGKHISGAITFAQKSPLPIWPLPNRNRAEICNAPRITEKVSIAAAHSFSYLAPTWHFCHNGHTKPWWHFPLCWFEPHQHH